MCTEQGFGIFEVFSLLPRGWALAQQGEVAEGIAQLRQGFAGWSATGAGVISPWWLALLAEACGQVGQFDEGLRALEEALTAVQHNDEHNYEAEVYRLKGELLLQQSAAQQGEAEEQLCPHRRPPPAGEIVGAAGGAEPEPAVAAAGQVDRGLRAPGAGLWLVHRGV